MTHKQVKFGKFKRSRKVKPVEEEYESGGAYRRSTLLSSGHVDRLAEESSRARLINQYVSPEDQYDTREFASYYRAPTRYIDPPYSITSHTNAMYIPKALQVIPTYPTLIPAQWCPSYVRQTPEQYAQEMTNRKYNCRCLECKSPDCPARDANRLRARRVKDNIMTFCDQSTMTRNLNDASCGCTPTSSTLHCPTTPVQRQMPMVRLRNFEGKVKFHEGNHKQNPAPILKNTCNAASVNTNHWKNCQEEYDEYQSPKPMSVKCCIREDETRKNLYNEGISDVVLKIQPYPSGAKRKPAHSASRVSSRTTVSSGRYSDSDANIPHSHRSESRYHKNCVEAPMQVSVQDEFKTTSKQRVPVSSPSIPCRPRTPPQPRTPPRPMTPQLRSPRSRTPCCSGTFSKPKQRIIKLPKKLLTSEKVVSPQACKVSWGNR